MAADRYGKIVLALMLMAVFVMACTGEPTGNIIDTPDDPFSVDDEDNVTDVNDTDINDTDDADLQLTAEEQNILSAINRAEGWTRENSSTFVYDGSNLNFESIEEMDCTNCWNVTLEFTSSQAGYGDRSGEATAQVLTEHTINIVLRQNRVVTAITDNTYNEITEQMLQEQPDDEEPEEFTQANAVRVAQEWVREEAGTFVESGSNLDMRSVYPATCLNCWTIVFDFDVNRIGYGFERERSRDSDFDNLDERRLVVRVESNEVIQALTDGIYDEVAQEFVADIDDENDIDEEEAEEEAEDWIRDNAETFRYDGDDLELDDVNERDCDDLEAVEGHDLDDDDIEDFDECWRVIFDFTSEFEGYGDRTGDDPDEDLTDHTIVIWIADGDVVSAITDNEYDEMNEEFI